MEGSDRPRPGIARFVLKEALAYALGGVLIPADRLRATRPGRSGPAVIFVHGYGSGPGSFALLRRSLRAAGYERFHGFRYRTRGATVDSLAASLGRFVQLEAPAGPLLLVGHSLGGVLCRFWIQELGGHQRTVALATLSAPHAGVDIARLARPLPVIRELSPDGPVMKRLWRSSHRMDRIPSISIVSRRDHFIRDPSRASFRQAEAIQVDSHGHTGLLFARPVHRLVIDHFVEHAPPDLTKSREDDAAPTVA